MDVDHTLLPQTQHNTKSTPHPQCYSLYSEVVLKWRLKLIVRA